MIDNLTLDWKNDRCTGAIMCDHCGCKGAAFDMSLNDYMHRTLSVQTPVGLKHDAGAEMEFLSKMYPDWKVRSRSHLCPDCKKLKLIPVQIYAFDYGQYYYRWTLPAVDCKDAIRSYRAMFPHLLPRDLFAVEWRSSNSRTIDGQSVTHMIGEYSPASEGSGEGVSGEGSL